MLSEDFFSAVCGPPLTANTAISKDIGIYTQTLTPNYAVKGTFKKSAAPPNCLAVSDTHVFAAQDQKAHVHVYSRQRGNQEAFVAFSERIRSLTLVGEVLVLGTAEGRLILWETCTGRHITTPPCHVQAVTCLVATAYHVLSASEDSNVNVWSLARLLELDAHSEPEPDLVLSNHRGAVTSLTVAASANPETSICVSASKDKTCIVWNYRSGEVLRTLLFPSAPLCVSLDPAARALFAAAEDGSTFLVELYGDRPLLGSRSAEPASIVVQVTAPLGKADEDAGPASCLAVSYDGTTVLTGHTKGKLLRWSLAASGHPTELANLNASVTNLTFMPLLPEKQRVRPGTIVKPNQNLRQYTFNAQLDADLGHDTNFSKMLNASGFSPSTIERALLEFDAPAGDQDAESQKAEKLMAEIVESQRPLFKSSISQQPLAEETT
ncbi:WD repeat-containing protein [Paramyrothecium foliicola]|nr:WD repeat-containing protein [Paramyrothecium foliicola]